jgi:hypothetical protein
MVLLQRRLNGTNEVVEVADHVANDPGVEKFTDFLKETGLQSTEGLLELAQVLKVPVEQMIKLTAGGLIEGPAQENIHQYLFCRVPERSLQFLRRQGGEAGTKNYPSTDHSDFKDNCG